jgi:signal transduction histidine kinase
VLRLIERTAREGLAEARMSVLALSPADGWPGSLDQSLEALAERSSIRGGFECRFESSGKPCAMPGPVQESLLRIAQEATSNAMRHSGGTRVSIRLDYVRQRVRLTIEDDGRGLSSVEGQRQSGGFGVSGMESRAAAIGGSLRLGQSSLGGLAVHVDAPCHGSGDMSP